MELSQQLVVVGLVLGLMVLCLFLAQRRGLLRLNLSFPTGRTRVRRNMELVERLALTPHHGLQLIRSGESLLLIATHPRGVDVIERSSANCDPPSLKTSSAAAGRQGGVG